MKNKKNRLKPKYTYLTEVQVDKLKEKMFKCKLSGRKMATLIPMGVSTLCNKLNGREELTQTQIFVICRLLAIPLVEINDYFFDSKLSDATKAG